MFTLRTALASLIASLLSIVLATQNAQVPLGSSFSERTVALGDYDPMKWNIDESPNPNLTDHLVFDTACSLLQHWGSTRTPCGHNIVPGVVPKGTLLHHARSDSRVPEVPDWIAMDPTHAYFCCGRLCRGSVGTVVGTSCWFLTLVTTRPLKVVYFDGMSAFKVPYGTQDTQDLLAWGESNPERIFDERERIEALCNWGKHLNVDGFVRTEMAFEIVLCDFTSGTDIVSFANTTSRYGIETGFKQRVHLESWRAGARHNHFPGETRIQLDLSGLVSFYDTQLAPSLVAVRASQTRAEHRVKDISKEDLSTAVARLEAVLTRPPGLSSGLDWRTLIQIVVDKYAEQLDVVRHLLNITVTSPDHILDLARKTQMQLRIMLTPYLSVSAVPPVDSLDGMALEWAAPIYIQCATIHTRWVESEIEAMTESEKLLLQAIRGTVREICRVLTRMWTAGVYAGIDSSVNSNAFPDIGEVKRVWNAWREDLNKLMAWLDWSVWAKCEPGCGFEEICFLGLWPQEQTPHFPLRPGCLSAIDVQ